MSELIKIKIHRNDKYATIALHAVEDPRLTWAAKGLHTYLISRPPEWEIRQRDLLNRSSQGKTALFTATKVLSRYGYLKITKMKDDKGRWTGTLWEVFETPPSAEPQNQQRDDNIDKKTRHELAGLVHAVKFMRRAAARKNSPYPDFPDTVFPAADNRHY